MTEKRPNEPLIELADIAELWINPKYRRGLILAGKLLGAVVVLAVAYMIFSPRGPDMRPTQLLRLIGELQALSGPPDYYGQGSMVPRLIRSGTLQMPFNDPSLTPTHPFGGPMRILGQGASARLILGALTPKDCVTVATLCKSQAQAACRSLSINEVEVLPADATVSMSREAAKAACQLELNRIDFIIQPP